MTLSDVNPEAIYLTKLEGETLRRMITAYTDFKALGFTERAIGAASEIRVFWMTLLETAVVLDAYEERDGTEWAEEVVI